MRANGRPADELRAYIDGCRGCQSNQDAFESGNMAEGIIPGRKGATCKMGQKGQGARLGGALSESMRTLLPSQPVDKGV
jgi:hypothetical protein